MLDPQKYKAFDIIKDFIPDGIFVEIGCHKFEGSTMYIGDVVEYKKTKMYSIDVDKNALDEIENKPYLTKINKKGEEWLEQDLPNLNEKISVLFLDNFDWFWNDTYPDWTIKMCEEQRSWYKNNFNIEQSNLNSQMAHLKQGILVLPYMAKNSFIFIDDTWRTNDEIYCGKGGAVIPFLLLNGYSLLYEWGHMPILTNNISQINDVKELLANGG